MGPSENPTSHPQNQATSPWRPWRRRQATRRPRRRRCLLKGCEKRYRPQQALQRYCSAECREAARAWARRRAQERYRATPTGKERRKAQSRRYRERVRSRPKQVLEAAEAAARVITTDFFRGLLRPAGLLRRIHVQPEVAAATVLFEGVPASSGARLGAGAALAGGTGRTPNRPPRSALRQKSRPWRQEPVGQRDRRDILTPLRPSLSFSLPRTKRKGER